LEFAPLMVSDLISPGVNFGGLVIQSKKNSGFKRGPAGGQWDWSESDWPDTEVKKKIKIDITSHIVTQKAQKFNVCCRRNFNSINIYDIMIIIKKG
jgi:protoporphyrinogen oxidase